MSMKKPELGFLSLGLTGYIALGAAAIILGMGVALKFQTARLDSVKQEYATFKAQVKAAGDAAKVRADAENKLNEERKKRNEAELRKLRLANAEFKRLRDNAPSRRLPEAPADSRNPELACFDRPELERAYGKLVEGLRGLADEGTESTLALDSVKRWAQGQ
jgi:hypothetical protein